MSANRYLRHLYILPEDDANHQIANGFLLDIESRQVQVLAEAGGWTHVCEILHRHMRLKCGDGRSVTWFS